MIVTKNSTAERKLLFHKKCILRSLSILQKKKMNVVIWKYHQNQVQDQENSVNNSTSTSVIESQKNGVERRNKERRGSQANNIHRKKKSWYSNVFFPTYKSRSADFKKIFRDIPDDERLIVDYSCALQREILVHGRLYVSQNYACFYANIFMWETLVTIRWKDITSITKEKTALVIPNAITLHTATNKFFFTSFGSRDKTFMMIFKIWKNALMEQPMTTAEIWQLIHDCYGEQLGLTSEDDDYVCPSVSITSTDKSPILESLPLTNALKMELSDKTDCKLSVEEIIQKDDVFEPISFSDIDVEPTSYSETEFYNDSLKCISSHIGRELVKAIVPINIDQLFTLLFTNSKFFLDFHTSRKTTDLVQPAWTEDSESDQKVRTVSLTMALSQAIGPKSTQVTETQVMLPCSKPGHIYSIDTESVNSGVPYANSFTVFSHYCITKISENKTNLVVYSEIKYKKNVWGIVKNFIEKNCWTGMEDYFDGLLKALNAECKELNNCEESMPVKRIRHKQIKKDGVIIKTQSPDHTAFNHKQVPKQKLPFNIRVPDLSNNASVIIWMLLIFVATLLISNAFLCYKLWIFNDDRDYTMIDLSVLKNLPKTEEDWINLIQQQESLHNIEMKKWQRVLQTAIQLLRQTDESLSQLQMSVHPTAAEKLFSMLKSELNEGNRHFEDRTNEEL